MLIAHKIELAPNNAQATYFGKIMSATISKRCAPMKICTSVGAGFVPACAARLNMTETSMQPSI